MDESQQGCIVVISGPTGVGKTTIIKEVLSLNDRYELIPHLRQSESATTRKAKLSDLDSDKVYRYLSHEEFSALLEQDKIIEWIAIDSALYGALLPEPNESILFESGASGIGTLLPTLQLSTYFVFLVPPGENTTEQLGHIEDRLRSRGNLSEREVRSRLSSARLTLEIGPRKDAFTISSDDTHEVALEIFGIMKAHFTQAYA
jgi:guanylate kinase